MQVCSFRLGSARYDSRLWNNSWSQELYYIVLRMYRSSLLGKAGMSVLRSYSFHLYQLIQLPLVSKAAQGQSWQETTQLSERGVAPQYLRIPYSQHSNRLSETGTSRLLRILNNHSITHLYCNYICLMALPHATRTLSAQGGTHPMMCSSSSISSPP